VTDKQNRKQDPELLAIARMRRLLEPLNEAQRLSVLEFVSRGEVTAQGDARRERNQRAYEQAMTDKRFNPGGPSVGSAVGSMADAELPEPAQVGA